MLRTPRPVDPVRRELDEYFEGRRQAFDLSVDLRGLTPFSERVLTSSPASRSARRRRTASSPRGPATRRPPAPSARSMNRNPVPIVLPCHRVIGATAASSATAAGSSARWRCSRSRACSSDAAREEGDASPDATNASPASRQTTPWNASTPASRTAPAADGSNGVSPVPLCPRTRLPRSPRSRRPRGCRRPAPRSGSDRPRRRRDPRVRRERSRGDRGDDGREPDGEEADAREPPGPRVAAGRRGQEEQLGRSDRGGAERDRQPRAVPVRVAAEAGRRAGSARSRAARRRARRAIGEKPRNWR